MSKQIGCWRTYDTVSNVSSYMDIFGGAPSGTEFYGTRIVTAAGYVRNLAVILTTGPSGGDSWLFTIYVNGAPSAVTCGIASGGTTASDTTNYVAVSVGDKLSLRVQGTGNPTVTGMRVEVQFESTTAGESMYAGNSQNTLTTNRADGPWNADGQTYNTTSVGQNAPMAGTITRLYAELSGDPTPGTYTCTIFKNAVAQDGSGGTPDTRVAITAGNTTGNSSFSLSVSAGDSLYVAMVLSGSPTARHLRFACNFISGTAGYSIWGTQIDLAWHQTATEYWRLCGMNNQNNGTVDTEVHATVQISGFDLKAWYLKLNGNPGTSPNAYTATVRKAVAGVFADTAMTASVIGASATEANDGGGNTVSFAVGDDLSVSVVPTSNPTLRAGGFCCVLVTSAHGEWSPTSGSAPNQVVLAGA